MKRFAFKLEKLLELRSFYERRAELVLAEKAGKCALIRNRLAEVAEAKVKTSREMFAPGRDFADFRASELYLIRLDKERDSLLEALVLAELELEAARKVYIEKHRDREAITKLKERRQADYYRAALREETKTLDDIARRRPVEAGGD